MPRITKLPVASTGGEENGRPLVQVTRRLDSGAWETYEIDPSEPADAVAGDREPGAPDSDRSATRA